MSKIMRQVIRDTIRRIDKKITKIDLLINANPLKRISEINRKHTELVNNWTVESVDHFLKEWDKLSKEEAELWKVHKKTSGDKWEKLWDKKYELECEKQELEEQLMLMSLKDGFKA